MNSSSTGLAANETSVANETWDWVNHAALLWEEFLFRAAVYTLFTLVCIQYLSIGDRKSTMFYRATSLLFLFVVVTSTVVTALLFLVHPFVVNGTLSPRVEESILGGQMLIGGLVFLAGFMCANKRLSRGVEALVYGSIIVNILLIIYNTPTLTGILYAAFLGIMAVTLIVLRYHYVELSHVISQTLECSVIISACIVYILYHSELRVFSFNHVMPTSRWQCTDTDMCSSLMVIQIVLVAARFSAIAADWYFCDSWLSRHLTLKIHADTGAGAGEAHTELGIHPGMPAMLSF